MPIKHAFIHFKAEWKETILKSIFYSAIFAAFFTVAFIALSSTNQVKKVKQNLANAVQVKKTSIDGDYLDKNGSFTEQEIRKLESSQYVKSLNTVSNSFGNIQNVLPYIRPESKKNMTVFKRKKEEQISLLFLVCCLLPIRQCFRQQDMNL